MDIFSRLTSIKFEGIYLPNNFFTVFIRSFLLDMLWSYSLVFAIYVLLWTKRRRVLISVILASVTGSAMELFQLAGIASGTFDLLDITFEIISACIAGLYIFYLMEA